MRKKEVNTGLKMKFFLSGLGNWAKDIKLITEAVIEADGLDFDGALMPDHYMWGKREWGKRPDDYYTLETWIMLAYLTGKTERIHLGTLVTPIPFRPPSIMAKMVSTLDVLSKGRVIFGVGAGWSREEFEGFSEWNNPKIRVDKTKEGLELMIKLWTEDNVTFEGKYYRAKAAVLKPKPIQKPYPQLLFGGRGDRMLKLTGRYADICFLMARNPKNYNEMKEKVLKAAEKANRLDKIAFMMGSMGSRSQYDSSEYTKQVEVAIETGASYFLTAFPQTEFIETMKSFSREVMSSFK